MLLLQAFLKVVVLFLQFQTSCMMLADVLEDLEDLVFVSRCLQSNPTIAVCLCMAVSASR